MSTGTSVDSLEGIAGAFMVLCSATVALRFTARKWQSARFGLDDWTMLASLLCFIGFCVCLIGLVRIGAIGWHSYPFPDSYFPTEYEKEVPWIVASDVAICLVFMLTKISALLLYKRIFCPDTKYNKTFSWIIYITIIVLVCWMITFVFLAGFQCGGNFKDDWEPAVNVRNCGIGNDYAYGLFVSDLILDVWVIGLPIPRIMALEMPLLRKLSISGAFCLAFVGVAASALRLAEFLQIAVLKTKISRISDEEDFNSIIFFYNTLEAGMMMISINVPVFWSFVTKNTPKALRSVASNLSLLVQRSQRSQHSDSAYTGSRAQASTDRAGSEVSMVKTDGSSDLHEMDNLRAPSSRAPGDEV